MIKFKPAELWFKPETNLDWCQFRLFTVQNTSKETICMKICPSSVNQSLSAGFEKDKNQKISLASGLKARVLVSCKLGTESILTHRLKFVLNDGGFQYYNVIVTQTKESLQLKQLPMLQNYLKDKLDFGYITRDRYKNLRIQKNELFPSDLSLEVSLIKPCQHDISINCTQTEHHLTLELEVKQDLKTKQLFFDMLFSFNVGSLRAIKSSFVISGEAKIYDELILFTPSNLDFGKLCLGSSSCSTIRLTNPMPVSVEIELEVTQTAFSVHPSVKHLEARQECLIEVHLDTEKHDCGDIMASLAFKLRNCNFERRISLTGLIEAPKLRFVESFLDFGIFKLKPQNFAKVAKSLKVKRKLMMLSLMSHATMNLQINRNPGVFVKKDVVTLKPNRKHELTISFAPTKYGPVNDVITLCCNSKIIGKIAYRALVVYDKARTRKLRNHIETNDAATTDYEQLKQHNNEYSRFLKLNRQKREISKKKIKSIRNKRFIENISSN